MKPINGLRTVLTLLVIVGLVFPFTQPDSVQAAGVPKFSHIIVLIFENEEYSSIIGKSSLHNFNNLARQYALLTNYYAVGHPSLPNYVALTSGSSQGFTSDCGSCSVGAANLADLIEGSKRTWKAYMESMPAPCTLISSSGYTPNHDPFVHYNDIRNKVIRCQQHVVPLTQLDADLKNQALPSFAWITPNLCHSGHDCSASSADQFLGSEVNKITGSAAFDQNSLLIVTFDEGTTAQTCCNLPSKAGGHVATILISKLVKPGYQDATPYSHYALLKTIETSWGLKRLGHSADSKATLITSPWH